MPAWLIAAVSRAVDGLRLSVRLPEHAAAVCAAGGGTTLGSCVKGGGPTEEGGVGSVEAAISVSAMWSSYE